MGTTGQDQFDFYTQARVLDAIRDLTQPSSEVVAVILKALRTREDIRRYFFLGLRNPAWARVFDDCRLFYSEASEDAPLLWPLMSYLSEIADQVPDVVERVALTKTSMPDALCYEMLQALARLPVDRSAQVASKVPTWLSALDDSSLSSHQAFQFARYLVTQGHCVEALPILKKLLEPLKADASTMPYPEKGRGDYWFRDGHGSSLVSKLAEQCPEEATDSFLRVLQETLHDWPYAVDGAWRSAIEDTSQDQLTDILHTQLVVLRDLMEAWGRQSPISEAALERFRRLLEDSRPILRRLGLHLVRVFASEQRAELARLLLDRNNLSDYYVHHEMFLLLKDGYPILDNRTKEELVRVILEGPSSAEVSAATEWASENRPETDAVGYAETYRNRWILERLWMIKDSVKGQAKRVLGELVRVYGEPIHPEFPLFVSPLPGDDSARVSKEDLLNLGVQGALHLIVEHSRRKSRDRDSVTRNLDERGMAEVLGQAVAEQPQDFVSIGSYLLAQGLPSAYMYFYLDGLRQAIKNKIEFDWEPVLSVCESLSGRGNAEHNDYLPEVYRQIANLIWSGFSEDRGTLCGSDFERAQLILLALMNHPDPDERSDQPPEGWFGYRDPATVAINHVRPVALAAYINWLVVNTRRIGQDGAADSRSLCTRDRKQLERMLTHEVQGTAVHSVFGRFFRHLVWLDRPWTFSHIDSIFDESSKTAFSAAFDSYLAFNHMSLELYPLLRGKYTFSIRLHAVGDSTKSHLQPERSLAFHILLAYAYGLEELPEEDGADASSPLTLLFQLAPSKIRAGGFWAFWRALCPPERDEEGVDSDTEAEPELLQPQRWRRIWLLIGWHLSVSARAGFPSELDEEIEWFVSWLQAGRRRENLGSAYPVVRLMLPHLLGRRKRFHGMRHLEEYLAQEVNRFPSEAARILWEVNERLEDPYVSYARDHVRHILEVAAEAGGQARTDALQTIDRMARRGIHEFRDIYDRFAHSIR